MDVLLFAELYGTQTVIYPYIRHGVIGARLLRAEAMPEEWARVAERHTGTGITMEDIISQNLDLPLADYCPETMLEKLICYADKFLSRVFMPELRKLLPMLSPRA